MREGESAGRRVTRERERNEKERDLQARDERKR